jgi:hypothetical protein
MKQPPIHQSLPLLPFKSEPVETEVMTKDGVNVLIFGADLFLRNHA